MLLALAALVDLTPWQTGRAIGAAAGLALLVLLGRRTARTARRLRAAGRLGGARVAEMVFLVAAGALWLTKVALWIQGGDSAAGRIYPQYSVAFSVMVAMRLAAAHLRFRHLLHRLELAPSQTVAGGFALTILGGGLLLSLPISVTSLERLDILDALFTATSAVTVTGLSVYDPGTYLTTFGQIVLLLLVQVGGLGTMVATASLVLLAGRRMHLKHATALQEAMDVDTVGNVRTMLVTVLGTTFVVELVGTVLLYLSWRDMPIAASPFTALFHAVTAFCNAGFSLFRDNLMPIVHRPAANAVIALLVIVGGIGFPVIGELVRRRPRVRALSLHARLTLLTTGALLLVGTIGILVFEWRRTLAPHGFFVKLMASGFHSVVARSAGFNTLDVAAMGPAALMWILALMFVGGSPGGTAGGIKTTTAATVVITLRSVLRGRERVEAFGRTIPLEQVQKALAVVGVSAAVLFAGTLLLVLIEDADPLKLAFEAVSAFGTTGLSAGVTSTLSPAGKLIIMLLMFIGRTGPMTLAFAVAARERRVNVQYPEEKIMIG